MRQLWKKPIVSPAPRRLEAVLAPKRVRLAAFGGLLGRKPLSRQESAVPAVDGRQCDGWRSALGALEQMFEVLPVRGAALTVAVSSQWLRFLLVPQREELGSAAECLEYARHMFVTRFGVDAEAWAVRLVGGTAPGARIGCAMAPALIADLQTLCQKAGVSLRSVEPLALAVFNEHDKQLVAGRHWFVVPESGATFVALLDGGAWQSVAVRRAAVDSPEVLARLLDVEHQFLGVEDRVEQVMACKRGSLPLAEGHSGYRFTWLDGGGGKHAG